MSPVCHLEMTLSGGLWGEGGSADERWRVFAARSSHRAEAVRSMMWGRGHTARRSAFDTTTVIDPPGYTLMYYIVAQEDLPCLPMLSSVPASTKRPRTKPPTCCAP